MKKYIGIDAGTRSSAICVINEAKEVVHRWQGSNLELIREISEITGEKYCVVEAGPLSENMCEQIEACGANIEIVDSRHTKALLQGKKKTDKIDAQKLAELAALGWYKPVFRKGGKAREQRTIMHGRSSLVKVSTQLKNTIRGLLKGFGIVIPLGTEGKKFIEQVQGASEDLSEDVKLIINDLLFVWYDAYERQRKSYKHIKRIANKDEVAKRLMTVPGVGPAVALSFVSTIVNPNRFPDGKQMVGYLGLAPRVHQSGDTHYHGRITKQGDKSTRWLLVEAAHILLTRVNSDFPLKKWGLELAEKKGLAKARVAVARRLALALLAIWKDGTEFQVQEAA